MVVIELSNWFLQTYTDSTNLGQSVTVNYYSGKKLKGIVLFKAVK